MAMPPVPSAMPRLHEHDRRRALVDRDLAVVDQRQALVDLGQVGHASPCPGWNRYMPRSAAQVRSNAPSLQRAIARPACTTASVSLPTLTGCSPAAALICEISLSGRHSDSSALEPLDLVERGVACGRRLGLRLADHGDRDDGAHHLARLLVVGQLRLRGGCGGGAAAVLAPARRAGGGLSPWAAGRWPCGACAGARRARRRARRRCCRTPQPRPAHRRGLRTPPARIGGIIVDPAGRGNARVSA